MKADGWRDGEEKIQQLPSSSVDNNRDSEKIQRNLRFRGADDMGGERRSRGLQQASQKRAADMYDRTELKDT
jgi:hypothetical protein